MEEQREETTERQNISMPQRIAEYLICAVVLALALAFLLGEKREFSESENRTLAALPELSAEGLRSGAYTAALEDYAADQFPLRDLFLTIETESERRSGRREINGVYLASDGALIRAYEAPQNTERILTQLRRLAESVGERPVYLMLVPSAVTVERERLPRYAPDRVAQEAYEAQSRADAAQAPVPVQNQADAAQAPVSVQSQEDAAQVPVQARTIAEIYTALADVTEPVDALGQLLAAAGGQQEPPLYYRTDHHWTTYGAYLGYLAYCEAAGLTPIELERYAAETVSTDFRGTNYARLNDPLFGTDTITAYRDPTWELSVSYEDTGVVTDSLYNDAYLTQRDQYSFFLDNAHPLITVTNPAAPEGALALVKDSYANSMVPYLTANYRTIYIFDTRYYRGGPSALIREHEEIKAVLILYNMNTIDTDSGIGGIY